MKRLLAGLLILGVSLTFTVHEVAEAGRRDRKGYSSNKKSKKSKKRRAARRSSGSKWSGHWSKCSNPNRLSSTMYFLPREGRIQNFSAAVTLQGTGIRADNTLVTYDGRNLPRPYNCTTTQTTSSGYCLLSYFSVAADFKYHNPGDIIYVPAVRGLPVQLPDSGEVVEHPGAFVIVDQGAAIKGVNRFDFFTGTDKPSDANNPFRQIGLGDKHDCSREFFVIRPDDEDYEDAWAAIMSVTDSKVSVHSIKDVYIPIKRVQDL